MAEVGICFAPSADIITPLRTGAFKVEFYRAGLVAIGHVVRRGANGINGSEVILIDDALLAGLKPGEAD